MPPEVGAGGVVGLSLVEDESKSIFLRCGVQRDRGGDGDCLAHEADGAVRDGVRENICL